MLAPPPATMPSQPPARTRTTHPSTRPPVRRPLFHAAALLALCSLGSLTCVSAASASCKDKKKTSIQMLVRGRGLRCFPTRPARCACSRCTRARLSSGMMGGVDAAPVSAAPFTSTEGSPSEGLCAPVSKIIQSAHDPKTLELYLVMKDRNRRLNLPLCFCASCGAVQRSGLQSPTPTCQKVETVSWRPWPLTIMKLRDQT